MSSESLFFIALPLPYVIVTICLDQQSDPIPHIFEEVSLVLGTVPVEHLSVSLSLELFMFPVVLTLLFITLIYLAFIRHESLLEEPLKHLI